MFNKLVSVNGDVSETDVGLSEDDRQSVVTEVNIAFHSADTVRLNESLKSAVILNTLGIQSVILLCGDIQNLQVLFHCSVELFRCFTCNHVWRSGFVLLNFIYLEMILLNLISCMCIIQ
jgi:fatty acyl-CoA reductase